MEDFVMIMLAIILMGFFGFCVFMLGQEIGKDEVYKENFERGFMTQCVGRSGYYWEC